MISQPILNCQRSKSFVYKIIEYFEKLCNVIENTIVDKFVTEKNKRRVRISPKSIKFWQKKYKTEIWSRFSQTIRNYPPKKKKVILINLNNISKKDHSLIFRPLVRLNRARFSNILVDFQPNFKP